MYTDSHDSTSLAVWIQPQLYSVFPRGERKRAYGDQEGGRGRRMTLWSGGFWSIALRWLKFPACQAWWIWLKIKESGGPWRADEWMNELCCSFTPYLIPKKTTLPDNPRRQLRDLPPSLSNKDVLMPSMAKRSAFQKQTSPFFPKSRQWEITRERERESETKGTQNTQELQGFLCFH